jgi:hypothetical protein
LCFDAKKGAVENTIFFHNNRMPAYQSFGDKPVEDVDKFIKGMWITRGCPAA